MENAAEALRIAFAVFVFVIALAVSFFMISQARQTADVVFAMEDDSRYFAEGLEGITYLSAGAQGEQLVGWDTVVSEIYRYNLGIVDGVTIMDGSDIIARFSGQTEDVAKYVLENNTRGHETYIGNHMEYLNKQLFDFAYSDDNWKILFKDIYFKQDGQYMKWRSGAAEYSKKRFENDLDQSPDTNGLGLSKKYSQKLFSERIETITETKPNGEVTEHLEIIFTVK